MSIAARSPSGSPPPAGVVIANDSGAVTGGGTRVAVLSAEALAGRGIPVRFVCGRGDIDVRLRHPGIEIRQIDAADIWTEDNPLRAAADGVWSPGAARGFAQAVAGLDP